ncbi:MAG TPA: phosphoenolpyruvate--protein phosphotransferase [Clostridiaceae bacterium]
MKKGLAASIGYAIGRVVQKTNSDFSLDYKNIEDWEAELVRFNAALVISKEQINDIIKIGMDRFTREASLFESHILLLEDVEFVGAIIKKIKTEMINSEKAIFEVVNQFRVIFNEINDEYMKERFADVLDVANRLRDNLVGKGISDTFFYEDTVLVASDMTPSETAMIDKDKVIAFVTDMGAVASHSSIIARTLEIPAVVGLKDITRKVKNGDYIIVDGFLGTVIINPSEEDILIYKEKKASYEKESKELKKLIKVKTITKMGKHIEVAGNIGNPLEVKKVIENGGEGIGLFRTEFIYMNRDSFPSEEEQFEAYKYPAIEMKGKPVIIRTLDIGGDKKLDYFKTPQEDNPVLGLRGIRLCLLHKDIFKVQLRALLRASVYGNIKIMFPMVAVLDEYLSCKKLLKECMGELIKEGKDFNENIQTGIMVEIPAAALNADDLAKHVDFFSIGTNDLIQYTLAADRMNEKISYLYDGKNPAVIRLIKMTIQAAHKEGKYCGLCGEIGSDVDIIPTLIKMGLDEFSVIPSAILKTKKVILEY